MKRSELFFTALQVPIDFLALLAAGTAAYFLRIAPYIRGIREVRFVLSYEQFIPIIIGTAIVWMILFALQGLYTIDPNRKFAGELRSIILGCTLGLATITIYSFFRAELFNSRFIVLAAWILAIIFVTVGRLLIRVSKRLLYRHGFGRRRTVIIGSGKITDYLVSLLGGERYLGYAVVAIYPIFNEALGEQILSLSDEAGVDEILLTSQFNHDQTMAVLEFADTHHFRFRYTADLYATLAPHMSMSTIADIPIVDFKKTPLDGWGRIVKRVVDLVASALFLIILSPLIVLVAIGIHIETGLPIIFKNVRVGEAGRLFRTLKFRTMRQKFCVGEQFANQDEALQFEQQLISAQNSRSGPIYKITNDPRVTRFGKILRRSSIDELPQLWNVLVGDMSLVGPRPHQPREVAGYSRHHLRVHSIRPGITGLAQISGRSDLEFEDEMKLDIFYLENWSLLMDLFILLKTPIAVIKRRKAL